MINSVVRFVCRRSLATREDFVLFSVKRKNPIKTFQETATLAFVVKKSSSHVHIAQKLPQKSINTENAFEKFASLIHITELKLS